MTSPGSPSIEDPWTSPGSPSIEDPWTSLRSPSIQDPSPWRRTLFVSDYCRSRGVSSIALEQGAVFCFCKKYTVFWCSSTIVKDGTESVDDLPKAQVINVTQHEDRNMKKCHMCPGSPRPFQWSCREELPGAMSNAGFCYCGMQPNLGLPNCTRPVPC